MLGVARKAILEMRSIVESVSKEDIVFELNKFKIDFNITKGNDFFYSLVSQIEKGKRITDKQFKTALSVVSQISQFKKMVLLVDSFKTFDEAFTAYQDKMRGFKNPKARKEIFYYISISHPEGFDLWKEISRQVNGLR